MRRFWLALAALLLCAVPHHAQSLEGSGVPIVITNVTVIDTTGGPSRPDMTVICALRPAGIGGEAAGPGVGAMALSAALIGVQYPYKESQFLTEGSR